MQYQLRRKKQENLFQSAQHEASFVGKINLRSLNFAKTSACVRERKKTTLSEEQFDPFTTSTMCECMLRRALATTKQRR